MEIVFNSLHNLDMKQDMPVRKEIPYDFNSYIEAYIQFATTGNDSIRSYNPIDSNRTVLRAVSDIFWNEVLSDDKSPKKPIDLADSIALKLLDVERGVQERIGQMTDVQKGSVIQALLKDDVGYKYVIAKVEHSEWYDGETLEKNFGFPGENKRVWKSAVIGLDCEGENVSFPYIDVYVNHVAKYWTTSFLEVKETKTDVSNTRSVFNTIDKAIRRFKETAPLDYYNLRNTALHELQSEQIINYPEMISKLLDAYSPSSDVVNVSDVREKLLAAGENGDFDTQFNTVPEAVKRAGRITIHVSPSIDIVVKEGISNWKDEFLSHEKIDGRTYLMIRCDDENTLSSFPKDDA